tara:strand:+ start:809 stop:1033 length:225 start_codon:yes stop_codon:yes gene_type:complete
MEAKEKAKELVDRFAKEAWSFHENTEWDYDKHCALICVDEIINTGINKDYIMQNGYYISLVEFYTEVKQEINKL